MPKLQSASRLGLVAWCRSRLAFFAKTWAEPVVIGLLMIAITLLSFPKPQFGGSGNSASPAITESEMAPDCQTWQFVVRDSSGDGFFDRGYISGFCFVSVRSLISAWNRFCKSD